MHIGGIDFGNLETSFKNCCNCSASFPLFSNVINSNSTVNLTITNCFENFHKTVAILNVTRITTWVNSVTTALVDSNIISNIFKKMSIPIIQHNP